MKADGTPAYAGEEDRVAYSFNKRCEKGGGGGRVTLASLCAPARP